MIAILKIKINWKVDKMNILKAEIQEEGKRIQIETDNKGAYKYIWLDSENLIDIAEYSEYLD